MKFLYFIYYRNFERIILRYCTNSKELYLAELKQLRKNGVEIVKHWKEQF